MTRAIRHAPNLQKPPSVSLLFTINRQGRSARAVAAPPARAEVVSRAKSIKCRKTKLTIKTTKSHKRVKRSLLSIYAVVNSPYYYYFTIIILYYIRLDYTISCCGGCSFWGCFCARLTPRGLPRRLARGHGPEPRGARARRRGARRRLAGIGL